MAWTSNRSAHTQTSPFKRIGQQLDARKNAKGNALGKQLQKAGIDPERCFFEMIAVGPIFDEQADTPRHRKIHDQVGALEPAMADRLRHSGHEVIGSHPKPRKLDPELFAEIRELVDEGLTGRARRAS